MLTPHGDEKGHLKGTVMTDVDTDDLLTVVVSGAADTHISSFTHRSKCQPGTTELKWSVSSLHDDEACLHTGNQGFSFFSYLLMAFFRYCCSHLVSGLMHTSLLFFSLALQREEIQISASFPTFLT